MKITTFNNFIAIITSVLVVFFMSFTMVFAGNPNVNTLPAGEVSQTSVRLNGVLDPNGVRLVSENIQAYFMYGTNTSQMNNGTQSQRRLTSGAFTTTVHNLEPNTTYYFEAVIVYQGEVIKGDTMSFTTASNQPAVVEVENTQTESVPENNSSESESSSNSSSSSNTSNNSTNNGSTNNTASPSNTNTSSSHQSNSGSATSQNNTSTPASNNNNTATAPASAASSANPVQSNHLSMSLENNVDTISRNDVIAYDLELRNTRNQAITDTMVFVDVPRNMEVFRVNGAEYVVDGNTLIFDLGTINAGQSVSIRIMTEMRRAPQDATIIARAQSLYMYGNTAMTNAAVDIDTYEGNTSSSSSAGLAASAGQSGGGGIGFFGWFVILLVIVGVVIGIRIFRKKKVGHSDYDEFYQDADGSIKPMNS